MREGKSLYGGSPRSLAGEKQPICKDKAKGGFRRNPPDVAIEPSVSLSRRISARSMSGWRKGDITSSDFLTTANSSLIIDFAVARS